MDGMIGISEGISAEEVGAAGIVGVTVGVGPAQPGQGAVAV
jgi:hypothetical protein